MTRRGWLRILVGGLLLGALGFVLWNPGAVLREGLRDNLIAESLGAIVTVAVVDTILSSAADHDAREAKRGLAMSIQRTLDVDLRALRGALASDPPPLEAIERDAPRPERVDVTLAQLCEKAIWEDAPAGNARLVRARIRDLGEDAERLLVLSENVADFPLRAHLDALRRACRTLDEGWESTPRGSLSTRFAQLVAPEVRAVAGAL